MNSTATALTFQSKTFDVVQSKDQIWLTLPDIAAALYRKAPTASDAPFTQGGVTSGPSFANAIRQIQKIYQNHADEFTASMTKMLRLATAGGPQMVRVFSLRGAHLIAMFARTPVAKEFRRWVLDILEPQTEGLVANAGQLDEATRHSIEGVCWHMEFLYSWFKRIEPGLKLLTPGLTSVIRDHFIDGATFSRGLVHNTGVKSMQEYAAGYPWDGSYTDRDMYRRRMARVVA